MNMPFDGKFSYRDGTLSLFNGAPMVEFTDGGLSGYNNPENAILEGLTDPLYNIKFTEGKDK